MYTNSNFIKNILLFHSAESSWSLEEVLHSKKLNPDSHLTSEEVRIMKELYESQKEKVIEATKWQLKDFIIKDYGEANRWSLWGFEWIINLQKALKMEKVDGSFWPDTFKALIDYQTANWLEKDGIAWPETMKKMGITRNLNISSAPTNKNTQRWWITNSPSSNIPAAIEMPRKDVWKILSSFDIRLKWIQSSLDDNKKYRDENTGTGCAV